MPYKYLVLDSQGTPVAHCISEDGLEQQEWLLEADPRDAELLAGHTYLKLVGTSDRVAAAEGRVVERRGDQFRVESVRKLGREVRKNLRLPVRFESYLYPISGGWRGRYSAVGFDLSCGGVAFYCGGPLEIGEQVEIVIPVTVEPLVLRVEILRRRPSEGPVPLWAAKFLDLLHEEEMMVREAVFSLQLRRSL